MQLAQLYKMNNENDEREMRAKWKAGSRKRVSAARRRSPSKGSGGWGWRFSAVEGGRVGGDRVGMGGFRRSVRFCVCAWSAPEARSAEGDGAASAAPSAGSRRLFITKRTHYGHL